ncbi:MAG: electron transfer flavoprotein subunit alpha/FixB family protein [Syntrophales bacterium]
MKEIVVWAEHRQTGLMSVSLELLSKATELAHQIDATVSAVLIGYKCDAPAEELIRYGASRVFVVDDPQLDLYQSDLYPGILARVLDEISPEIVLIGGTFIGMDLAPRVAAKLKTGLTAHCVNLYIEKIEGKDQLVQVVPGWGGNMFLKIICPDHRPQMATVRPGVMDKGAADPCRSGIVIPLKYEIPDHDIRARTLEFIAEEPHGRSLDDAGIIVSGGFGVGSREGFELLEELARVMHGEAAGTRPACDQGWIPESRMIGQSGKTVRPRLFLSIGASGAVHYTTGFLKSKVIVGIDKNPKAPIFGVADLGIVGDFRKIIPCLIEELKEMQHQSEQKGGDQCSN